MYKYPSGSKISNFQVSNSNDNFHYQEITFEPNTALNTNALSSTATQSALDFHIYSTPGKQFYDLYVQFTLNESTGTNSAQITPVPWFVERIEYRTQNNDLIQTMYSYNIFKNLTLLSNEQAKKVFPLMGINPETWKPHFNTLLQPGDKRTYFMWLQGDIFSANQGIFANWRGYIILRLYLRGNIIESGNGNINVS